MEPTPLRLVFFGTPEFAVPSLEALVTSGQVASGLAPLLVVSQPSRPAGRGHALKEPPVIETARRLGLPFVQVESVRDEAFLARLRELAPDLAVVVAFGQIFRRELLELPRLGCFNVHASLLPKYRGAAPIQAAVAAGEKITGVTVQQMTRGLDAGPLLGRAELTVGDDETAEALSPRLAALGGELLVQTVHQAMLGELHPEPQDDQLATYAPRLQRSEGATDFSLTAATIYNRWRGFSPWPGLYSQLRGQPLKLLVCRPLQGETAKAPGILLDLTDDALAISCGGGTILGVTRVQRPGRAAISAPELWRGEHLQKGELFSLPDP